MQLTRRRVKLSWFVFIFSSVKTSSTHQLKTWTATNFMKWSFSSCEVFIICLCWKIDFKSSFLMLVISYINAVASVSLYHSSLIDILMSLRWWMKRRQIMTTTNSRHSTKDFLLKVFSNELDKVNWRFVIVKTYGFWWQPKIILFFVTHKMTHGEAFA